MLGQAGKCLVTEPGFRYLVANFDQRQVILKAHDAYASARRDGVATVRSCAPQLPANNHGTFGIEPAINLSNLANQLDVTAARLLVAR